MTSLTVPSAKREKVDFLVGDALGVEPYGLYQVTVDMSLEKTRRREVSSLEAGMRAAHLDSGTIITLREQGQILSEAGRIDVVPVWKWALL